jgi:type II secretory pathway component PulK
MKKARRNGFVLVIIIMAVAIMSVAMYAFSDMMNTMQSQSQTAYIRACRRNLQASGLVWAKENIRNKSGEILDRTIQLDVSKMNIRVSALDVTISRTSDNRAEVQVDTSCSRGRQTLNSSDKYGIEFHDQQETTIRARENPAGD